MNWKPVIVFFIILLGFSTGYGLQTLIDRYTLDDEPAPLVSLPEPVDGAIDLNQDPYVIDVTGQNLATVPNFILERPIITNLVLSNNRLSNLPDEIGEFSKLRVLELDNNQLTALPAAIGSLQSLIDLKASHNRLTAIPPQLGQLTERLLYVDLSNNEISFLPPELENLSGLKWLNLAGNPIPQNQVEQLRDVLIETIINF